jgi:hypothetical protein
MSLHDPSDPRTLVRAGDAFNVNESSGFADTVCTCVTSSSTSTGDYCAFAARIAAPESAACDTLPAAAADRSFFTVSIRFSRGQCLVCRVPVVRVGW